MSSKPPRDKRFNYETDISHDIVIPDIHYDGRIFNLSREGIYFESDERVEPGDQISITIKKLDGNEVTFDVEILRRKRLYGTTYRFGYGGKSIEPKSSLVKVFGKDLAPTPIDDKDCREYCRKIYNKLLRFRYENKNHNAWIRDISRGGAFIETNLFFPIGKKIVLTIPARKARKVVRIQGWIVRCSEAGFGIKFNRRTDSVERRFDIDRRNGPERRQK